MVDSHNSLHIVISCEHAGNIIPDEYKHVFSDASDILKTHRALDIGVKQIAEKFSSELSVPIYIMEVCRLLVDCNRSDFRRDLFSEFTDNLSVFLKGQILQKYYYPYRKGVEQDITRAISNGQKVLHLSIHTFTPVLDGIERYADIGLLFDESRPSEKELCTQWNKFLDNSLTDKIIALNYPYNGAPDGFTSYFRRKYSYQQYLGIEIEINQKYAYSKELEEITSSLIDTLRMSLV